MQVLLSPYSVQAAGAEANSLEEGAEATDATVDTNDGEEADEATLAKQMALEEMRKLRQDPRHDASFCRECNSWPVIFILRGFSSTMLHVTQHQCLQD